MVRRGGQEVDPNLVQRLDVGIAGRNDISRKTVLLVRRSKTVMVMEKQGLWLSNN